MTILCTDFEGEVLRAALDKLANGLIHDEAIGPPLVGMADIVIDTATELAQRIDELLHPDNATLRAERERMQENIGSMIAVFTDLKNPL